MEKTKKGISQSNNFVRFLRECYDESVIFVPKSPLRRLPFRASAAETAAAKS